MGISIALPFRFNEAGAVDVTPMETKTWSDRVISALMTKPSERLMRPTYGSNIQSAVFETESMAIEIAKREVPAVFAKWLPDLTLIDVNVAIDSAELAENTLVISVEYLLPNKQKGVTNARVRIGSFTPTGLLIEEIE